MNGNHPCCETILRERNEAMAQVAILSQRLKESEHAAIMLKNSLESEDRKMCELLEILNLNVPTVWSVVVRTLRERLRNG